MGTFWDLFGGHADDGHVIDRPSRIDDQQQPLRLFWLARIESGSVSVYADICGHTLQDDVFRHPVLKGRDGGL